LGSHNLWPYKFNACYNDSSLIKPNTSCCHTFNFPVFVILQLYTVSHLEQGRQCMHNVNTEACSCNHCRSGRAIRITYSEREFVALGIQQAKHMCCIILSFVAPLALQHFSTLSHKQHYFQKKLQNIKCLFWFSLQLLSGEFLILRSSQSDIIINVCRS
jgi:hypothetical protein